MINWVSSRASFVLAAICSSIVISSAFAADPMLINGAGASFPYPLYSKWFSEYRSVDKSVEINYQSIGSGGGIRQFLKGTTDFGASDAPMKESEIKKSKGTVLHIPTTLGAVAVTYNIPGVKTSLRMTPEIIVGIFSGKIKKWDDKKITSLNPKVQFPKGQHIVVAHRSDGSGTTAIFTDYLSKVSEHWATTYGKGKSIKWPTGLGGKGNEGVTGLIRQNPGAVGYVEMTYAINNSLQVASIKNRFGDWVLPSVEAVSLAAAGALANMPADYRTSITNPKGKGAYPISAFTYLLVHKQMDKLKGKKIMDFLNWAMGPGQKMASPLKYAPLPGSLIKKVKKTIASIELK